MQLQFSDDLLRESNKYDSKPQQERILSEGWVSKELYCPRCGERHLTHLKNGKPAADFKCENCNHIYEFQYPSF